MSLSHVSQTRITNRSGFWAWLIFDTRTYPVWLQKDFRSVSVDEPDQRRDTEREIRIKLSGANYISGKWIITPALFLSRPVFIFYLPLHCCLSFEYDRLCSNLSQCDPSKTKPVILSFVHREKERERHSIPCRPCSDIYCVFRLICFAAGSKSLLGITITISTSSSSRIVISSGHLWVSACSSSETRPSNDLYCTSNNNAVHSFIHRIEAGPILNWPSSSSTHVFEN